MTLRNDMEREFIYERKKPAPGLKVEEVTGGEGYHGKVWRALAMQIYCENGRDDYREVGHFASGAPFLYNADEKISISHTDRMLVVATIPVPEDANLSEFDPRHFIGVDTERADREKVLSLRERFLTADELALIPENDLEANIIAWTAKEAMYKAALTPGINWHNDLIIKRLPKEGEDGEGLLRLEGGDFPAVLSVYRSGDYLVTLCRNKG